MKITIDFSEWPENDLDVLKKWCSVSRTFDAALVALESRTGSEIAEEELLILRPVLDRLHQQVRNKLVHGD